MSDVIVVVVVGTQQSLQHAQQIGGSFAGPSLGAGHHIASGSDRTDSVFLYRRWYGVSGFVDVVEQQRRQTGAGKVLLRWRHVFAGYLNRTKNERIKIASYDHK